MVGFMLAGEPQDNERIAAPLAAVSAVQKAHPKLRVAQFGDASSLAAIDAASEDSKKRRPLVPGDADHPADRVRRLRRRGRPAAPRPTAVMAAVGLLGPLSQTHDRLQVAFPGGARPATVREGRRRHRAAGAGGDQAAAHRAIASGHLMEPSNVQVSPDKTVAQVMLSIRSSATDDASNRSSAVLPEDVIQATVGDVPGVEVAVTGVTAGSKDFLDVMQARLPLVFAFVLSLAFVLLLVTFGSIVVSIKAIVLNLLSAGAAYGVLVLVFQDGRLESALDHRSVGGITPWLALFCS